MGRREEPNWLLSVKGAGQGEAHVWEQEETWLFHSARNCSEYPRSNLAWPRGWTFLLTSQKPERKDEDRQTFLFPNHEEEQYSGSLPNRPSILSVLSLVIEKRIQKTQGVPPKKRCPWANPQLKTHYKEWFIHTELIKWPICLQSTENH